MTRKPRIPSGPLSVAQRVEVIWRWSERPLKGCTDAEIEEVHRLAEGPPPADYLEWLRLAGHSSGDLLVASDLTLAHLSRLQMGARMLLEQDGGPELPSDAFVFLGHQGYAYLWFPTAPGAEPGVYRYVESDRAFSRVSEDFRTWLEEAVRDELGGPR
jgi:hypothetical protein